MTPYSDLNDYEYQQDLASGNSGGLDEYDPTPLERAYSEGDETKELFWSFWLKGEDGIDPGVYKGTYLDWSTLEQYRALNPRTS